jgi:hypothetical protein
MYTSECNQNSYTIRKMDIHSNIHVIYYKFLRLNVFIKNLAKLHNVFLFRIEKSCTSLNIEGRK